MTSMVSTTTRPEDWEEYNQLLAESGKALAGWMGVETQLQQSFAIALGARQKNAAKAVFRAANSANARLKMSDEAITRCLDDIGADELLAQWRKLEKKSRQLAARRNLTAHSRPALVTGPIDKNGNSSTIGARMSDPLATEEIYNHHDQMKKGISTKQLGEMQAAFQDLAYQLYVHGQEMDAAIREFDGS